MVLYFLIFLLCFVFKVETSQCWQNPQVTCSVNNSCLTNSTNVNSTQCPVLFQCKNSSKCECTTKMDLLVWYSNDLQVAAIIDCYCVTSDSNQQVIMFGLCLAQCGIIRERNQDNNAYYNIPRNINDLNSAVCGESNRDGQLCGRCKHDFYPRAYSYNLTCIHKSQCKGKYGDLWKYILAAYGPLTLFCFVILLFRINITSSYLLAYVVFSQIITSPYILRPALSLTSNRRKIQLIFKILSTIHSIWSLDFFKNYNICLKVDSLTVVALEYCIALYPFLLTFISYQLIKIYDRKIPFVTAIWKPVKCFLSFFQENLNTRTAVVDAYTTFFLLSYSKIVTTSFSLLMPTMLYSVYTNETKLVLFYDGTKEYFHRQHLPYGFLAIVMCFLFNLLPIVILLFYHKKWFQFFLSLLPCKRLALNATLDCLQCCYKDGLEPGTRDCRWFLATFLSYWITTYACYAITLDSMFFFYSAISCIIFLALLAIVQPYKEKYFHFFQLHYAAIVFLAILFLLCLSQCLIFLAQNNPVLKFLNVLTGISVFIPNVLLIVSTFHWLMSHCSLK